MLLLYVNVSHLTSRWWVMIIKLATDVLSSCVYLSLMNDFTSKGVEKMDEETIFWIVNIPRLRQIWVTRAQ